MGYLERKSVTVTRLTCSHPKVERIWEYGGCSQNPTNGKLFRYISIILKSDTPGVIVREDFKDNGDGSAEIQLEKYLENLK